jgi:hypothetical protein
MEGCKGTKSKGVRADQISLREGNRVGIPTGMGSGEHRRTVGEADGRRGSGRAQKRRALISRPRRHREVESHCDRGFTRRAVCRREPSKGKPRGHPRPSSQGWATVATVPVHLQKKGEWSYFPTIGGYGRWAREKVGKGKWFGWETYRRICIRRSGVPMATGCPSLQPNQNCDRGQHRCREQPRRPPQAGVRVRRVGYQYPHPAP